MSTISQSRTANLAANQSRLPIWLVAAISPLAVAPLWFAVPQTLIGPLHSFGGLLLFLLLAISTASDLTCRKIFNWATYTALAWAIAINSLPGLPSVGAMGLANSVYGAAACFAIMLVPYTLARGGAGDVKLATAIGALTGIDDGMLTIAFAYILAAVAIAGWTCWTKGPFQLLTSMFRRFGSRWFPHYIVAPSDQQSILLDKPIPLAGFFALATLLVVFDVPALFRSI